MEEGNGGAPLVLCTELMLKSISAFDHPFFRGWLHIHLAGMNCVCR